MAHTQSADVNVGNYSDICVTAYKEWERVKGSYPGALQQEAIAHGVHTALAVNFIRKSTALADAWDEGFAGGGIHTLSILHGVDADHEVENPYRKGE